MRTHINVHMKTHVHAPKCSYSHACMHAHTYVCMHAHADASKQLYIYILTWKSRRGDLRPKYLHVAAFAILFNFICNITMFSSWIFTFNPTPKVEWGREKVCRQNICCHVSEFENLFNMIWSYSVKNWFWPFDPQGKRGVGGGSQPNYFLPCCCIRDSL